MYKTDSAIEYNKAAREIKTIMQLLTMLPYHTVHLEIVRRTWYALGYLLTYIASRKGLSDGGISTSNMRQSLGAFAKAANEYLGLNIMSEYEVSLLCGIYDQYLASPYFSDYPSNELLLNMVRVLNHVYFVAATIKLRRDAQNPGTALKKVLPWYEIVRLYPNQWVVLDEVAWTRSHTIASALVVLGLDDSAYQEFQTWCVLNKFDFTFRRTWESQGQTVFGGVADIDGFK